MPFSPVEVRECFANYGTYVPTLQRPHCSRVRVVPRGFQTGVINAPRHTPTALSASGVSFATLQRVLTTSGASADVLGSAPVVSTMALRILNTVSYGICCLCVWE